MYDSPRWFCKEQPGERIARLEQLEINGWPNAWSVCCRTLCVIQAYIAALSLPAAGRFYVDKCERYGRLANFHRGQACAAVPVRWVVVNEHGERDGDLVLLGI